MGPCWSHREGKKDYLGHAYLYEGACVYVHVNIGVVTLMSMCVCIEWSCVYMSPCVLHVYLHIS